jgi:hypothetical protein
MQYKEVWLASEEKLETHKKMEPLILGWLQDNPKGNIITLPGNSGRQENWLLEQMGSEHQLFTVDRTLAWWETRVRPTKQVHHVKDDFWSVVKLVSLQGRPVLAWADLTGCLHDRNREGWMEMVESSKTGSIFFITLATGGILRGWDKGSLWRSYRSLGFAPVEAAEMILGKNLEKIMQYQYRHGKTNYTVFGFKKS